MTLKWIRLPERRLLLNFSDWGTWHLNLAWDSEITSLVLKDAEPGQALHLNRLSALKIWLFILMHRYGFLGLITNLCISNVWPLFSLLSMQTGRPPKLLLFFPFTQLKMAIREDLKFCILLLRNRGLWKIAFYVTQGKLAKRGIFSCFHSHEHDPSYI